ncbi:hypothetical protein Q3A66_15170 [Hymenobacter sp. BT770]|uniref:hypothetical protein n=1 Tax=Hymenobacter sp. BT770 TaxID=2886942 RepID=UPI001D1074DA|nr:hypothetical protein [Hymenobacter sp. BT770]MCC3154527.1 hypothetical protein [Hymenobacter sp. BT770]MDO3416409.1 hypothetical protein [Hymenobacter sp. BT770]
MRPAQFHFDLPVAPTNTLSDLLSPTYQTAEATLPVGAVVAGESGALSAALAYAPAARSSPEPEVAPKRAAAPPLPRVLDRETGGQFVLGQNHPNPYLGETTVPFTLTNGGDVRLDLFDLAGRKVAGINRKGMLAGEHAIPLNLSGLGLAAGQYVYQLQVTNSYGVYRQSKTMTAG